MVAVVGLRTVNDLGIDVVITAIVEISRVLKGITRLELQSVRPAFFSCQLERVVMRSRIVPEIARTSDPAVFPVIRATELIRESTGRARCRIWRKRIEGIEIATREITHNSGVVDAISRAVVSKSMRADISDVRSSN